MQVCGTVVRYNNNNNNKNKNITRSPYRLQQVCRTVGLAERSLATFELLQLKA